MVTVTTDAFGEWAMRGVESASYQYLLDDPAWTMVDSKDVGPGSPADGAQILITAAPVRVFRLRFVHASTETTVVPQSVRVTPPPGVFGKHVLRAETDSSRWLSDGKQGRRLPAVSAARGVYEGYVVFDSKQAAEDTKSLLMLLSVHMYRQTFVQIPLHLSSALRATDEAHVVRLQPSGPDRGAGTLRIACPPRRHDGVLVSSERVLQARGEGVLAHFRGYPDGNGHWVFTGVPAGRLRVAMRTEDRWSWTDEVEVVLAPGQEAFAELEGRQPTGVFLRATDSQGRSILQFDHVHVESGDPPKSEPLQLPADVVRADESGLIRESVIGLRPGDYRLRVLAPGCKWTYTQPFKVTSGEVTIVNVALDSGP